MSKFLWRFFFGVDIELLPTSDVVDSLLDGLGSHLGQNFLAVCGIICPGSEWIFVL